MFLPIPSQIPTIRLIFTCVSLRVSYSIPAFLPDLWLLENLVDGNKRGRERESWRGEDESMEEKASLMTDNKGAAESNGSPITNCLDKIFMKASK